jgi:hypothetical protein
MLDCPPMTGYLAVRGEGFWALQNDDFIVFELNRR